MKISDNQWEYIAPQINTDKHKYIGKSVKTSDNQWEYIVPQIDTDEHRYIVQSVGISAISGNILSHR